LKNPLPRYTRPFLQPLAMIIICAVFVSLILITGLMDMRRVDRSLTDFMETRGLDIAEKIEKETQINYSTISQMLRGEHIGDALIPITRILFTSRKPSSTPSWAISDGSTRAGAPQGRSGRAILVRTVWKNPGFWPS